MMPRVPTLRIALAATLAACGDNGVQPLAPGLSIVSGDGITDTVQAAPPQPLVVRVIGQNGAPLSAVAVSFDGGARVFAGPSPATTDRDGFAQATIYLGSVAGEESVTVRVPSLGLQAIARFTVLPGNPVGVAVEPADTAVYVGGTVRLRGWIVDRLKNSRGGTLTYETTSPAVQLSGATLTSAAIGRARVVGINGMWQDTAWVSVVPPGAAVAVLGHMITNDTQRVVFFNLDGTGFRSFDVSYWTTPHPDWSPAGDVIALEDGGVFPGFNPHLILGDPSGPKQRLVPDSIGLTSETNPRYSADGAWIYFSGVRPGVMSEIWRVHPDGTGAERVSGPSDAFYGGYQPSPSPDLTHVVYTRNAVCCYDLLVSVLNVASGTIDSLQHADGTPTPGYMPRWSPVADVIAYGAHKFDEPQQYATVLWLINPDGSNPRPASNTSDAYWPEIDWSPDGRWLIAASYDDGVLHLIDTQTGLTLPLPFTQRLRQPSWRRESFAASPARH